MRTGNKRLLALVIGTAAISLASQALAQNSKRDAAIHACIIKVQKQYPNADEPSVQAARLAAYRDCMQAAGETP